MSAEMKMPLYEKLRNRRLFPKYPKKSSWDWLATIVNSAIFIWLLTAVVGSFVSFAFTNLQACWRDGDDKATKMNRTFAEIIDRREKIVFALKQSTTLLDFTSRVHAIPYTRAEFKDVPLPALTADLKDYQKITYPMPGAAKYGDAIMKAAGVTENDLVFMEILNGEPVEELTEEDFKNMKDGWARMSRYMQLEADQGAYLAAVPYCTASFAVASLFSPRKKFLKMEQFMDDRLAPFVPLPPAKE